MVRSPRECFSSSTAQETSTVPASTARCRTCPSTSHPARSVTSSASPIALPVPDPDDVHTEVADVAGEAAHGSDGDRSRARRGEAAASSNPTRAGVVRARCHRAATAGGRSGDADGRGIAAGRADEACVERAAVRVGGARECADFTERRATSIASSINRDCVGEALQASAAVAVDLARNPFLAGGPGTARGEKTNRQDEGTERTFQHSEAINTYRIRSGPSVFGLT